MMIATWNVNSLNVRLPHVLEWLERFRPDVLALQETKLPDNRFPTHEIEAAGYYVCFSGQKTYNGVAILSRNRASDTRTEPVGFNDPQRRLLAASINGMRIVNVYVPNGQEIGSEKYVYKLAWLDALKASLEEERVKYEHIVVLGDFNIAPADIDVHDPDKWQGKIMCSDEERAKFRELLSLGFRDALRSLNPENPMYTWWDYRLAAFRRGWGLRIDHILVNESPNLLACGVDVDMRKRKRPSDHAPVWLKLAV